MMAVNPVSGTISFGIGGSLALEFGGDGGAGAVEPADSPPLPAGDPPAPVGGPAAATFFQMTDAFDALQGALAALAESVGLAAVGGAAGPAGGGLPPGTLNSVGGHLTELIGGQEYEVFPDRTSRLKSEASPDVPPGTLNPVGGHLKEVIDGIEYEILPGGERIERGPVAGDQTEEQEDETPSDQ